MICLTQRLYSIEDRKIEGLKQQLLFQLSQIMQSSEGVIVGLLEKAS
jgi:hypothetical protein